MTLHGIFYSFIVLPIVWEVIRLFLMKRIGVFTAGLSRPLSPLQMTFIVLNMCYLLWVAVGLFTSHWVFFFAIFIFNWIKEKGPKFIIDHFAVTNKEKLMSHPAFTYIDCIGSLLILLTIFLDVNFLHVFHMKPFWI